MYYIAEMNIGRIRAPYDDPIMAGYVKRRREMDTLARRSPGFIWRRTGPGSNAKETDLYEDQTIIANVSVWATIEDFANFVYKTGHQEVIDRGHEWFVSLDGPHYAMWWVPQGHLPSAEEARERLEYLRTYGETPYAFTFKRWFPSPDERITATSEAYKQEPSSISKEN
ncbi:MAG: DUF3291 domain-containing protein [Ktedonobacteraceae bacterium]|nr:DUF3291 domain-containing protein [Ktedonobacteraceae bacterium]